MNFRYVFRQLGLLCLVLTALITVVAGWAMYEWLSGADATTQPVGHQRYAVSAMMFSSGIGIIIGGLLWLGTRKGDMFLGRREAMLLVAVSWLGGAALAAMPYWIWAMLNEHVDPTHPFRNFVDCYFEAMSGLTTTGSTVLMGDPNDIESLPRGLLLWRAATHWIGGLGIVVLFVAVLPSLGVGGKKLFVVEAPGPTHQGVKPRIRETARTLWFIYCGMTLLLIVLLRLFGMNWFDAVCHTFATLATGGFSTSNYSVGAPQFGAGVYIVISFFMLLAGVNFGLYYHMLRGRFDLVWKDPELRLYLSIILIGSVIVVWSLVGAPVVTTSGEQHAQASFGTAVQHGVFQVISVQTTTGFCSADFNQWSYLPKAVLIFLMFVGGSAGSTGGGIKVIRILLLFKVLRAELQRVFHPNVVRPIKIGKSTVDQDMRMGVLAYVLGILLLTFVGGFLLMLLESSPEYGGKGELVTCLTASIATLNNIGPGLEHVGAVENFGAFSSASKVVMSILMALGRLEVFAIAVLFVPSFWRGE